MKLQPSFGQIKLNQYLWREKKAISKLQFSSANFLDLSTRLIIMIKAGTKGKVKNNDSTQL